MAIPIPENQAAAGAAPIRPASVTRVLHVPLAAKVLGANAVLALLALATVLVAGPVGTARAWTVEVLVATLIAGVVVNLVLVWVALRPIRAIERAVNQLWRGDSDVRVPRSLVGDPELDTVGGTINTLLDHLEDDRARLRVLAAEVIRAGDDERARIGRELRDSIAQSLAAITYQLAAAENDCDDVAVGGRMRAIRLQVGQVLDEVDVLSHSVHPRVLNDLGLVAGLRDLARSVANAQSSVDVRVISGTESDFRGLGMETAAVLYRVAQDAVQNALRHSGAKNIQILVGAGDDAVALSVVDDGKGFDLAEAQARRPGMGLFTMRERVGLVRGAFTVTTAPGHGTTIRVRIPLERAAYSSTTDARSGVPAIARA